MPGTGSVAATEGLEGNGCEQRRAGNRRRDKGWSGLRFRPHASIIFICLGYVCFGFVKAAAQPVTVSGSVSPHQAAPNEEFRVLLSLDAPADLYFYGTEVSYDPDRVELVSA